MHYDMRKIQDYVNIGEKLKRLHVVLLIISLRASFVKWILFVIVKKTSVSFYETS